MNHIRGLALALALVLLLSACAFTAEPAPEPTVPEDETTVSETPQQDEPEEPSSAAPTMLSFCYNAKDTLNPYKAETSVNQQLLGLIYEGLFAVDPKGHAECRLCSRYEVSSDGRTYTLYLRRGVTMHDGKTMTTQDVIASLKAAKSSSRYAYRLRHILSILSVQSGAVTIELDTAYEDLPLILDVPIVRAGEVSAAAPSGTGPYRRTGTRLNRFADYWQGEDAQNYGEHLRLYKAASADEICAAFTDGRVSLACVDPNGGAGPTYHCVSDLYAQETNQMQYLGFNTAAGMFRSETLRAAVTYLIDRETLVAELCSSFASPAVLPCSPASDRYDRVLAQRYGYDPEKYWSVIESAGIRDLDSDGVLDRFPEDTEIEARGTLLVQAGYPERLRLAQRIADKLQSYGIELHVKALAGDEYKYALRIGNYDLYLGETALAPDGDLSVFFDPAGSLCLEGMVNEDLLYRCELALENAGNFYTLYEAILDQGLLCPIAFKQYAVYVQSGLGLSLTPALGNLYYTAWSEE